MTPLEFALLVFAISIVAGALGSLLGLGGGIIVIPALTLLFHIDIRYAIGASIVAVIATSSGAAASFVRDGLANLRVAMVLELATTAGALTGAYLAGLLNTRWLYIIFGIVMGYSAIVMYRKRNNGDHERPTKHAPWADYLRLHSSYFDKALGEEVVYRVVSTRIGLALMYLAGAISGLLGIGSGFAQSAGDGSRDANADQSFDRDEQLHDWRHGRGQRRRVFHARRHRSIHRRASGGGCVARRDGRGGPVAKAAKLHGSTRVCARDPVDLGANAVQGIRG